MLNVFPFFNICNQIETKINRFEAELATAVGSERENALLIMIGGSRFERGGLLSGRAALYNIQATRAQPMFDLSRLIANITSYRRDTSGSSR